MNHLPHHKRPEQFIHEMGKLLTSTESWTMAQRIAPQSMMDFGEYLHAARTTLNCTQDEFALQLGISEAQLVALEQGLLPRTAVDSQLVQRIAIALDEEEEILRLLLTDNNATQRPRPVAHWDAIGIKNHPDIAISHRQYAGPHYLFRYLSWLLTWTSLLYGLHRNLWDCPQMSRLTDGTARWFQDTSAVRLSTALRARGAAQGALAIALLLLLYWSIGGGADSIGSLVSVDLVARSLSHNTQLRQPSQIAATVSPSTTATKATSGKLASPAPGGEADLPIVSPTSVEGQRYRIIYGNRASMQPIPTAPYIEVDEQQFATIQFLTVTTGSARRCVTSGRFDLCPI